MRIQVRPSCPIPPTRWRASLAAVALLALVASACAPAAAPPAPTAAPKAAPTTAPAPTAAAPAASAPTQAPAAAKPAQKTYSLGMVIKNLVNPYFVNVQRGAENASKNLGVQFRMLAPSKPDNVEEQIQLMENLIQAKVDAIVLTPADSKALAPAVEAANKAKIPVFTTDTRIIGADVMTFVGVDQYSGAKQITSFLVDWVKKNKGGSANIIVLEGVPGASTNADRAKGSTEILQANPSIKVLASQAADYNRVKATSVTENLMTRYPNADLVFAFNDEMALGAIEALSARGKTPGKDIQVIGINAAPNALESVEKGDLLATLYSNEYCMAYTTVASAVSYLRDGTKPAAEVLSTTTTVVTKENLAEFKKIRDEQAAGATCK